MERTTADLCGIIRQRNLEKFTIQYFHCIGNTDAVILLLERRADVLTFASDGKSPLCCAANQEVNQPLILYLFNVHNNKCIDTDRVCSSDSEICFSVLIYSIVYSIYVRHQPWFVRMPGKRPSLSH